MCVVKQPSNINAWNIVFNFLVKFVNLFIIKILKIMQNIAVVT